jgi:hypothetical protein
MEVTNLAFRYREVDLNGVRLDWCQQEARATKEAEGAPDITTLAEIDGSPCEAEYAGCESYERPPHYLGSSTSLCFTSLPAIK